MAKWNLDKLSNVNQKGTTMAKTISKNNCTYVRTEILRKANVCVMEDRAADHGDMENNFKTISDLWSTFLDIDISPSQVGMLMCLLKIARQNQTLKTQTIILIWRDTQLALVSCQQISQSPKLKLLSFKAATHEVFNNNRWRV